MNFLMKENSTISSSESSLNLTRQSSSVLFDNCFFFGGLLDGGASNANLNNQLYSFGIDGGVG